MIVIAGRVEIRADKVAAAHVAAQRVADRTRREDGCLEYGFHVPLESPTSMHVFERWVSEEALARHLMADHTREFLATIAPMVAAPPHLWRHEVSAAGPLEL